MGYGVRPKYAEYAERSRSLDVARETQLGRVPRFPLCRSCLLTRHVAGGMRHESDLSWQYLLQCSLVVVMHALCFLRGLQHADIYTLHTLGLPAGVDQSLSKSRQHGRGPG